MDARNLRKFFKQAFRCCLLLRRQLLLERIEKPAVTNLQFETNRYRFPSVICGITTNHCCETAARISGNLGYGTYFVLDATLTFDRLSPTNKPIPAETLAEITAPNLHGEFATVISTAELL